MLCSKPKSRRASLSEYERKRDFQKTPEPRGRAPQRHSARFVVQEHHARRLHWDFRLESEGVLRSWAITSQPGLEINVRHLAVETEDHPLEYATFKGIIPRGEYGAGVVKIWDAGTYVSARPVSEMIESGVIEVLLRGKKLKGRCILVRMAGDGRRTNWLFYKARPKIAGLKLPGMKKAV